MTNTRKITVSSVLKASARFMEFKVRCRIPDTHTVALQMEVLLLKKLY